MMNSRCNNETLPRIATAKDVERMRERNYVRDWKRLGFEDAQSGFRITAVNSNYKSKNTSATWRHRNGAMLIRGALPHNFFLLQLSGAVVDLIDLQEASVMLSLEDGWDITAQISAIAQLCLDPYLSYYDVFVLSWKRNGLLLVIVFAHRSNLKPSHNSSNIAFAPTFLQFMDAV
ncbi:Myotubularin-related protein 13 [Lucilia cuprina]|nr:Myotubularin-related protein 13 [Lucilia cuprina]